MIVLSLMRMQENRLIALKLYTVNLRARMSYSIVLSV